MAEVKKRAVLLTPRFRVAFPQIETPMVFNAGQGKPRPAGPGEKGRYSLTALFPDPKTMSESEKAKWNALVAACNKVSVETFKKPMKDLDRASYKTPFRKGSEKEYAGFSEAAYFATLSAINAPGILNLEGERIPASSIYPGCYARASVNPFAYNNVGKGIAIGLNNIKFISDGERLDGRTSAEEDFGSDPEEYAADAGDVGAEEEVAF
jgi:hypothetical protein